MIERFKELIKIKGTPVVIEREVVDAKLYEELQKKFEDLQRKYQEVLKENQRLKEENARLRSANQLPDTVFEPIFCPVCNHRSVRRVYIVTEERGVKKLKQVGGVCLNCAEAWIFGVSNPPEGMPL